MTEISKLIDKIENKFNYNNYVNEKTEKQEYKRTILHETYNSIPYLNKTSINADYFIIGSTTLLLGTYLMYSLKNKTSKMKTPKTKSFKRKKVRGRR